MLPPGQDVQLDLIALIRAHAGRDHQAADAILRDCDALAVVNLAARLLAVRSGR